MANLGDLWHLRAAGKANSLGWSSFTIGGEVYPVGPGVVWSIPFEWAGVEGQDAALAAVRAYMLSKGDGNFGAHVNYGWMLNYNMLENMPGAVDFINTAAPWIVEQMSLSAATNTSTSTPTGSSRTASSATTTSCSRSSASTSP